MNIYERPKGRRARGVLVGGGRFAFGQHRADPGSMYERIFAIVPMTGPGTWDVPLRPHVRVASAADDAGQPNWNHRLQSRDARVQGSLPVALIPGVVPSKQGQTLASALQQNGGTANAVTLLGPYGTLSPNIDLGLGFFIQSPVVQGTMLLHELLHYATQENDPKIDKTYGVTVQGIGNNASAAFESWLEHDCNNPSN